MKVRLKNKIMDGFDEQGKIIFKDVFYDLKRCEKDNFTNDLEKEYYKQRGEDNFLYCVDDKQPYLQGDKSDYYRAKDHSYFVYDIERCTEESRDLSPLDPSCDQDLEACIPKDPECADNYDIDFWLDSK